MYKWISNAHLLTKSHVVGFVFLHQILSFQAYDDDLPELEEAFGVWLDSAVSADGMEGSTPTSGASIHPNAQVSSTMIRKSYFVIWGRPWYSGSMLDCWSLYNKIHPICPGCPWPTIALHYRIMT